MSLQQFQVVCKYFGHSSGGTWRVVIPNLGFFEFGLSLQLVIVYIYLEVHDLIESIYLRNESTGIG